LTGIEEDSGPRTIPFAALLLNDRAGPTNENDQALNIISVANPVGGGVSVVGGAVIFTPFANFTGDASFVCTVQDNGTTAGASDFKTAAATVRFFISPMNDFPVAHSQNLILNKGTSILITLTGNDGDP